jgi:large subunit ribosomal protein L23
MALFSRTKKTTEDSVAVAPKVAKKVVASKALPTDKNISAVIIKPRVTEKAVRQNDKNVYTFIVRRDATKFTVADAVKALFKVTPVKVNIVNKAPKQFMSKAKGRKLNVEGMKKAYVYLKKGDRIDVA